MIRKIAVLSLFFTASWIRAEEAPQAPVALGPRFSGPFEVSFKPFADAKRLEKQNSNDVVRFERADKSWTLELGRIDLPSPVTLKDKADASGAVQAGYLSVAINQLRSRDVKAEVLRNEVMDLGELKIGLIIAQVSGKDKPRLLQEALIEVQPRLYYLLSMTSDAPGTRMEKTPALVEASDTFRAILDSVEAVDLSAMRQDQEERLFRTRALYVDWSRNKLLSKLQPARMLRFRQDGKDIGYAYVVEQPADALPRVGEIEKNIEADPAKASGLRVGIRARVMDKEGKSVETENWMYVTFDRKHEVWSLLNIIRDPQSVANKTKTVWFSQVGASDSKRERVFNTNLRWEDYIDIDAKNRAAGAENSTAYHEVDRYKLTVREEGSATAVGEPMQRDLPVFYIPQALAAMLPRLVPLDRATGYMFASYNNENRQIMLRYIDVLTERDVMLSGKTVRAIPVVDRLGFDGAPTTHYLSPKGDELGAIDEALHMEVTPTDEATLLKIWKDVNLAQPDAVKE